MISGSSDDFEVSIRTSDWGKNITAALITGALTLGIGFLWAGVSAATYKMFEEKLSSYINDEVLRLSNNGAAVASPTTVTYPKELRAEVRTPTPQELQGPMRVIVIALLLVLVVIVVGLLWYLFSHPL